MIDQLELTPPPPPFVAHSATSREAATLVFGPETDRQAILRYLKESPEGRTDEEMQTVLGLPGSTQRPRRIELVRMGKVIDSGLTRKTASGRQATIWRLP